MNVTKALIITTALSLNTYGETETFDMALSGEFSHDYCELSFTYSRDYVTYPIHPTENLPVIKKQNTLDSNLIYYKVQEDRWDIDCSEGEYTISASTLETGPIVDNENKFKGSIQAAVGGSHSTGGTANSGFMDAANPLTISPHFDGSDSDFYYITTSAYVLPLDGQWENSGTEFNFNFNFILTIEKVD